MPRVFNLRTPGLKSQKMQPNYYQKPADFRGSKSPFKPKQEKKNSLKSSKIVDALALVVLSFALIYSLIVSPSSKVIVNDQSYHTASQYMKAVSVQLQALKNRNKISFDQTGIENTLRAEFPETADINIEIPILGQKPIARFKISSPSFILNSQGQSYVLDSKGVVTYKASGYPSLKNLPVLVDQSNAKPQSGRQFISSNSIDFINGLIAQCKSKNVTISNLTLPAAAQELNLRTSDKSYYVKFNMNGDLLIQAGQFFVARNQFKAENHDPTEYLDVRVLGKIFYK